MERFEDAVIGDKVYCRIHGFGIVLSVVMEACYPIRVKFEDSVTAYTKCGRIIDKALEPTLFYVCSGTMYGEKRPKIFIKASLLEVDTKVVVSDGGKKRNRHFAYLESNKIYTYDGGFSSWTGMDDDYDADTTYWPFVKLGEKVVINDIVYPIGTEVIVK